MNNKRISLRNLQIITFIDSLSYGLLQHIIPLYIEKSGGNFVGLGIYTSGVIISELISSEITNSFEHVYGKKNGLSLIFSIAMLVHIMVALTKKSWFLLSMRLLFCAINQAQKFCLALLLDIEENRRTRKTLYTNFKVLSAMGHVLGPIISGHLYDKDNGFRYIGLLAAFLALTNLTLLTTISHRDPDCDSNDGGDMKESLIIKAPKILAKKIDDFKNSEVENNWDILLLKYLFSCSSLLFLSYFGFVLMRGFGISSSVIVGYSIAYLNALICISKFYLCDFKSEIDQHSVAFTNEMLFFLITVLTFLALCVPNYDFFLLLLIPILFLRSIIMSMWTDLFSGRRNHSLCKLNECTGVIAGVTAPLLFGITCCCGTINHNCLVFFICAPLVGCCILIHNARIEKPGTEDCR